MIRPISETEPTLRPSPVTESGEGRFVSGAMAVAFTVLACLSLLRHALLQSNLYDLGIFDQAVYLISQGLPPFSTTLNFPILGDHAAVVLYPIALLYRLAPWTGWLLLLQAACLALGAWPLYWLARQEGLSVAWSRAVSITFLLYPAIFNVALYDFHPEVIAEPALLWAAQAGLARRWRTLAFAVAVSLGCKEVLSLTIMLLGVWLVLRGRRLPGTLVIASGLAWYTYSTHVLIPALTGSPPAAMARYAYLGSGATEIALNLVTHPVLLLKIVGQPDTLLYLFYLILPLLAGLHAKGMLGALPAASMLGLNLLSSNALQRNLVHQYALPIVPFLFVWLIGSLRHFQQRGTRRWLQPRWLITGALIGFLALAKFGNFFGPYLDQVPNRPAVRAALAQIKGPDAVLTTSTLAAYLAHRAVIEMTNAARTPTPALLDPYQYVLLDLDHPGWGSNPAYAASLRDLLARDPRFDRIFAERGLVLFKRSVDANRP